MLPPEALILLVAVLQVSIVVLVARWVIRKWLHR